ncbi:uncharacterized protein LY89DRAFT_724191 [Mollisia scopiformis]|uniref:Uncharacterized protein n=1 Tax=Mollisia scopiformis TaxID=149040 RepID=A0A132BCS7_MOLSC|nr:uncharacterized protein LY89DRAFT_724191 [Mollisia scopiformis]KUJ09799.1 hypothetical protein LY89DRAFT_724191 [Mollisia scopiformis]
MVELRDRIAAIQAALETDQEVEFANTPPRHSLDHRFDKTAPEVDAAPAPTPAKEKANPFESVGAPPKSQYYDSVAAAFGLGILDEEEFTEYIVYDAFVTNLRICPLNLTDTGHYYYVEHRSFLPNVPGVILRHGTEKSGKSLGAAHIPLQGKNTFGVGDYDGRPHEMVWERMGNTGFWTHMKYEFEHEIAAGVRKTFNWIRTRNNIMDDQGDLVLVEQGREYLVLCEYLGKGLLKWKKRGRLRIRTVEAFGESWEIVVLLTWASVIELSRRRARIRRYSPTHLIGI